MTPTKEHANDWPLIEPMPAKTRQAYRIRIDSQRAESLQNDFGFPDDCDMAGLLAWPQSYLSFNRTHDKVLTLAELRDTFSKMSAHIIELKELCGLVEVRTAFIHPWGGREALCDLEQTRSKIAVFDFIRDNLCLLEDFSVIQYQHYSKLTRKGTQPQLITVIRLLCAKELLTIWQNYKGDPRCDRRAKVLFYGFMERAFDVIGHGLTGDEIRVVQRKLRQVWDLR